MGTTSKPVRILVLDEDLYNSEEVQALIAKGHPIVGAWHCTDSSISDIGGFDLILGRRAWYMDTKHLKYLEKVAIPAARARITNREKEQAKK